MMAGTEEATSALQPAAESAARNLGSEPAVQQAEPIIQTADEAAVADEVEGTTIALVRVDRATNRGGESTADD